MPENSVPLNTGWKRSTSRGRAVPVGTFGHRPVVRTESQKNVDDSLSRAAHAVVRGRLSILATLFLPSRTSARRVRLSKYGVGMFPVTWPYRSALWW